MFDRVFVDLAGFAVFADLTGFAFRLYFFQVMEMVMNIEVREMKVVLAFSVQSLRSVSLYLFLFLQMVVEVVGEMVMKI